MRIYIAGPMTGRPDLNRPAFDAAERKLLDDGHLVINPHYFTCAFMTDEKQLGASFAALYRCESNTSYGSCAQIDGDRSKAKLARAVIDAELAAVRSCDAIYLLRGWETSRGAKKELAEALKHNLEIMQEGE